MRYSRAFQKFRERSSPYNEVVCLPSDEISIALYLESLIQGGYLDLSSSLPFFRSLYFLKATSTYSLRNTGMSYSRTREILLQAFVELGYPKNLFGLHTLRAGGAPRPLTQAG